MSELEKNVSENSEKLLFTLSGKFVEIPSTACPCGKPVLFVNGATEFRCSCCGTKWTLKIEVTKVTEITA